MKYTLFLFFILFIGCKEDKKPTAPSIPKWAYQQIDSIASCKIVPCPGITIIEVGKSYTASWTDGDTRGVWFKQNKHTTGLDFNNSSAQWYSDSCALKEDLRGFIKLQMAKYFVRLAAQRNQP